MGVEEEDLLQGAGANANVSNTEGLRLGGGHEVLKRNRDWCRCECQYEGYEDECGLSAALKGQRTYASHGNVRTMAFRVGGSVTIILSQHLNIKVRTAVTGSSAQMLALTLTQTLFLTLCHTLITG